MDHAQVFEISAAGMQAQKLRLEVAAHNLANVNTVMGVDGTPYQPMRVVMKSMGRVDAQGFTRAMSQAGVAAAVVPDSSVHPRMVHEPGHPHADAKGMVRYPGVNHLEQMMSINHALRAYEANVAAMQAAKAMATRALEIGAGQ